MFDIMRDSWHYWSTVKSEERQIFLIWSLLTVMNGILFKSINSILNVLQSTNLEASPAICEKFPPFLWIKSSPLEHLSHM